MRQGMEYPSDPSRSGIGIISPDVAWSGWEILTNDAAKNQEILENDARGSRRDRLVSRISPQTLAQIHASRLAKVRN
jgi:hypothetical protein